MRAIPQLVSAPLNPIPIAEHFRRSHPPCEHSMHRTAASVSRYVSYRSLCIEILQKLSIARTPYHFQEMHLFHKFLDIFIALITNSVHLTRIPNAKKSNQAKNKTVKTRLKLNKSQSWADFGIVSFFWFPPNYLKTYFPVYQSINQSIIYFNTLRQRAKKLVQNTNVYK